MEYQKDFFKKILDSLYDSVYFCDAERKISYWNKAAEKLTGYTAQEIIGTHCWDRKLVHTNVKGEPLCGSETCPAIRAMKERRLVEEAIYLKHKDGHRIPVLTRISPIFTDNGEVAGAVEIFSDNSSKMSAFMQIEKLEKLAFIDELTGIGNRRYSEIKIGAKLAEIERYAWARDFGLLFMDIDKFKDVNDKYGHDAGDDVLKMVAKTLAANLRTEDFIGRWGGEEFVAVISDADNKTLYAIAEKLRSLVSQSSLNTSDGTVAVTISIGATVAKRGESMEQLVKRADRFMYESKNSGRNYVTIG
ncbi:MAG: sensor domain-containing diguanylate cyclase [Candidatus Goldiibacteriota bacterium HGW-Goldbacteria-1]|nr:MAG: sensor domain-containing diguanylate cyclase [Candidatus Goldiibacteriota bacterium HGW-Goldbacteria-1]